MAKKEENLEEARKISISLIEFINKNEWSETALSQAMPVVSAAVLACTLSEEAFEHKDEIFEAFMADMKNSFELLYKKANEK